MNPGPFSHIFESELNVMTVIVSEDCKNLNICLFNARSLRNNYDLFTGFLTKLTQNTLMFLTETWLNETDFYPEHLLNPKNKLHSKSRKSKTAVNKSGGVAIWVPRDIFSKQQNDLIVINEILFSLYG